MSPFTALALFVGIIVIGFLVLIRCVFLKEKPATMAHRRALLAIEAALGDIFEKLSSQDQNRHDMSYALYKFCELCVKFRHAEKQKGLHARQQTLEQCQALLAELKSLLAKFSVPGERSADT